jgi:hypothetical protein
MKNLKLSLLPKTWFIDIDGVILSHNGHLVNKQSLIKNIDYFFKQIPNDDLVILITAREKKYKKITEETLKKNRVRFNMIIYGVPVGERILINDQKPGGLKTAIAINTIRDKFDKIKLVYLKEM